MRNLSTFRPLRKHRGCRNAVLSCARLQNCDCIYWHLLSLFRINYYQGDFGITTLDTTFAGIMQYCAENLKKWYLLRYSGPR
jgi:hypothetical protein